MKEPKGLFKKQDGTWAMTRCPKCQRENYALNVLSGICTWCGHDANMKDEGDKENAKMPNL